MARPKNLSALLRSPGYVEMLEEPVRPLRPGEALVEIAAAGVCGTDVAIWSGDYRVPLPLVLGHEYAGRVVEVHGKAAARLVGRPVVGEINNTCIAYGRRRLCEACRRGLTNHCLNRTVVGIISHPGAFARHLIVPAGSLHVLPRRFPLDVAVLVEPLAAAIRTFELTPLRGGETVVVLGCGRLGRLVALVASKMGARVMAVGRSRTHMELIKPFAWRRICFDPGKTVRPPRGTQLITDPGELRQCVFDSTAGLGADMVVEATGANGNLVLAQRLVRPQGTVAMKSTSGVPVQDFDTTASAVNEIRLQGSRCGPFRKALAFMRRHGIPNASWITARYPLEKIGEAIEAARHEPKVVVEVS
jgi:threonine dehydrogenase-like Zn-dependent dehydrogenase